MQDGRYNTWQSQEANPHRIQELDARDPDRPAPDAANRKDRLADLLAKWRRQLRTFLGQVAKCALKNLYAAIVQHATSLESGSKEAVCVC